ncbi:MAG TPA: alkyl sulfatase dimerization domain-containing protein [Polyangiales bacterium]|nr:alkyl sulfatase dimerization domain-containing protein [Polyangiales bacterium]
MRYRFTLLTTATAVALMSACSKEADTPPTPAPSEAPADAATAPVEAEPMGEAIGHFHPKGKAPSRHTIAFLEEAGKTLPLSDRRDFEEQEKGFIAAPDYKKIMADTGNVAWDMERYDWLVEGENFESIHPSTERQSKLNMNYGLYEVIPGFYQVRGFDLANMTFVKGKTGWIVFDPLTAAETARAAKALVDEHLGERPVVAVVYSHSHGDHWGGVRGIVDEADVRAGKVKIIAPRGFMQFAVSENVYAGNAMNRRLFYQYGVLLPASPFGYTGQGLGQGVAAGNTGLITPTRVIEKDIEVLTVDGVKMEFKNTPGAEAPAQIQTWFPEQKVFWTGEDVTGVFHNIYTLRGALVRDALLWSKYINEALYRYGKEAEVMIASHHWPRWGNERVQEVLRGQRDLYANINNQVLHLANQGVTINQIHNVYQTPKGIAEQWYNRGYHGSPEHNSRAVINRYLGYWDANPVTLIPLSPADSAPLYVEMMGGAEKILKKGKELHDQGKYRHAQEILNKLVQAQPQNQEAKDLLADVFEQIGYQQENTGLRNSFLAGAFELRSGVPSGTPVKSAGPDVVRAMSTELFLDFLGIKMDSRKAEGMEFTINLVTPDNGEQFAIELSNATLTNIKGYQAEDADLTLTIDRADLEKTMMGAKPLAAQIADGTAKIRGDASILEKLGSTMVDFDIRFEILPGTKSAAEIEDLNPYEVGPIDIHGE